MRLFQAWLRGAEQDILWAKDSLARGHSVIALARQLGGNGEIKTSGRELDLYYL